MRLSVFSPNGAPGKRQHRATASPLGAGGVQELGTKPHRKEVRQHRPESSADPEGEALLPYSQNVVICESF